MSTTRKPNERARSAAAPAEPIDIDAAVEHYRRLAEEAKSLPRSPVSVSEEVRQAAATLRKLPHCGGERCDRAAGYRDELANWLDQTADNMQDEGAYEVIRDRPDGSTYREVHIDGDCHVGLSSEWTAALDTARRINAADTVKIIEVEPQPRVSDERVQEILNALNSFPDAEYSNLAEAIDWACEQIGPGSDIANAFGPDADGSAEVELADGRVLKWFPTPKSWAVTVSDDTEAGVA